MSTIYNISAGFLQSYVTFQSKKDMTLEEMFKRLSIEMGGDGKSITKEQLDDYIGKAESGSLSVGKEKLNALKTIQKNWDTISKGQDSITFDNLKDYPSILAATMTGGFDATEISDSPSALASAIKDYLVGLLGLKSSEDITKDDLTSYLNTLLSDKSNTSSNDESGADLNSDQNSDLKSDLNSEIIGTLTNMIATFDSAPTVEAEV